ncbi:hypothetical protein A3C96_01915 [Candidatus Uhrbacteria bacterium RIFCSPHIGHO2_02_FULL_60_10]|uniref:PrgI family protein n=1 Tax=Candidatus Uhrbacteria bacterium RIFCSPHIGHO2_02_FULL_60_10 TaxID=1802392 RepID=A0A1F7U5N3_9BACT|nr:MAG: hypothetical protein A3C96_01915 [Candidatus Uhrbacteria bacterium RIFCSPHIGHO2_02_FULL_60_10]
MKYAVPQFIDNEDKVLGPITVRQFLIMMATSATCFVAYKTLDFVGFVAYASFITILGGIVAFTRINGMPFHYFLLNLVQTWRRPGKRIWNKAVSDAQLRVYIIETPPPPPRKRLVKEALGISKLTELSLIVNTGGVYNPDQL